MSDEYWLGLLLMGLSAILLAGGRFKGFDITLDLNTYDGKYTWLLMVPGIIGIIVIFFGMIGQL